jgi:hypothetical protein
MMIVYEPDWLTAELFDDAIAATKLRRAGMGAPPTRLRNAFGYAAASGQSQPKVPAVTRA